MSHAVVVFTGDRPSESRPDGPREIVVPREQPWAHEYPFASHWLGLPRAAGGHTWLHFVDEGPRDAPVIVFLHGNPTWSWFWRHLIVALRERYRCVAVDHLGMGLSDRPQDDESYRLAGHIDRVQALLVALGIERFRLVGHDWGGCIAAGVATREPARVDGVVWMNTAAFRSDFLPWSIGVCRVPVLGDFAVRGCNAFAGIATLRATKKLERLRGVVRQGYLAPYGNWHDRIATHRFVKDIPRDPSHPSHAELVSIEQHLSTLKNKPIALFWGDADFCFTPAFRARFEREFPAAEVHAWRDCGHYVVEDARERIVPLVLDFFARVDLRSGSSLPVSSVAPAAAAASKAAE
jgi:haloalkane dehalogenase